MPHVCIELRLFSKRPNNILIISNGELISHKLVRCFPKVTGFFQDISLDFYSLGLLERFRRKLLSLKKLMIFISRNPRFLGILLSSYKIVLRLEVNNDYDLQILSKNEDEEIWQSRSNYLFNVDNPDISRTEHLLIHKGLNFDHFIPEVKIRLTEKELSKAKSLKTLDFDEFSRNFIRENYLLFPLSQLENREQNSSVLFDYLEIFDFDKNSEDISCRILKMGEVRHGLVVVDNLEMKVHPISRQDGVLQRGLPWPREAVRFDSHRSIALKADKFLDPVDNAIYLGSSYSWYHFIIEQLSNLMHFPDLLENRIPIIIQSGLPRNIIELSTLLTGTTPIQIPFGSAVVSKHLYLIQDASLVTNESPRKRIPAIRALSESLATEIVRGESRKIYIYRPKGLLRSLHNKDEVLKLMIDLGIEVVNPEALDLKETMRLFKSATMIIGESGAAFTNLIFCEPNCRVLELLSPVVGGTFWRGFGESLGLQHSVIMGKTRVMGRSGLARDGFIVDINKVRKWILGNSNG